MNDHHKIVQYYEFIVFIGLKNHSCSWTCISRVFMNMHFTRVHEHAFYICSWTCSWSRNLTGQLPRSKTDEQTQINRQTERQTDNPQLNGNILKLASGKSRCSTITIENIIKQLWLHTGPNRIIKTTYFNNELWIIDPSTDWQRLVWTRVSCYTTKTCFQPFDKRPLWFDNAVC